MPAWKDEPFASVAKAAATNLVGDFRPDPVNAREQQALFMAGEILTPTLQYPKRDRANYMEKLKGLVDKRDDQSFEANLNVYSLGELYRQLYVSRFGHLIFGLAAKHSDKNGMRLANEALGYIPRQGLFDSIVLNLQERIHQMDNQAGAELDYLLPSAKGSVSLLPDSQLIEDSHGAIMSVCDSLHLPTDVQLEGVWEPEYFADLLDASLRADGITDWTIEVTDQQSRISVNQSAKTGKIPKTRRLPAKRGYATLAHERLHIKRATEAEKLGQYLLFTGTANNLRGEEGVTTALEQCLLGEAKSHVREDYYLGLMLAELGSGFRTVYTVLHSYYRFADSELVKEDRPVESPAERAWQQTIRTFRGTDCLGNRTYWGKDVVYAEGNLAIWQMLANDPQYVQYFTLGKFNPTDEMEVKTLVDAGVIPAL